ncbi:hypothetical protein ACWEDZ_35010, partial [Streptomyces sp. NPDC005047]
PPGAETRQLAEELRELAECLRGGAETLPGLPARPALLSDSVLEPVRREVTAARSIVERN